MMRSFFLNRPHPTKPPVTDSAELLRQVEAKDAKFRVFQSTFFVLVFVALGILLGVAYHTQSQNNDLIKNQSTLLKKQQDTAIALEKNDNAKLADLQNHIDCIVALFQQPNRANLTITNLQDCQLTPSSSGGATGSTKSQ